MPYKGNAPALNDVIGGHVPIMFDTITTSLPHVKSGKLKALAVTSSKRSPLAPDVPTMIEAGLPDFEVSAWYMVLGPREDAARRGRKLNAEINKVLQDAGRARALRQPGRRFRRRLARRADKFLRDEIERWAEVVAATGMKGN